MLKVNNDSFGSLRSFLWPIHSNEIRKFLPMFLMLFFVCFNYSVLRCMKDALVITSSGAAVIPFIKVWVMLPAALILTLLFTFLSNRFSQEKVFYVIISGFLLCYIFFAFVLYPMHDYIHPVESAEKLTEHVKEGLHGFIWMCCYWSFTLFYVLSELWGSLVMSVLFWGFANEVTKIHEARRFYSILSIGSNLAAIVAGQAANLLTFHGEAPLNLPFGSTAWEQSLMSLVILITLSGIATMLIFRWMNRNVLTGKEFDSLHRVRKENIDKKQKLSVKDSFKYLSNSKYLLCIATIVIGYNLTINLAEVVWKDQLRELYPNAADCNRYFNNITSITGVLSTIIALFMTRLIARFGWTKIAALTPVTILITCAGFFGLYIFSDHLAGIVMTLTGTTPILLAVYFGAAQNCLSKATKYSVFDTTKEMAFIPLDYDYKLKGKAAIDGVGSRFGKSGGSLIHQGLLLASGNIAASASYVAFVIFVAISVWIAAVFSLGKQFGDLIADQDTDHILDPAQSGGAAETKTPQHAAT